MYFDLVKNNVFDKHTPFNLYLQYGDLDKIYKK